MPSSRDLHDPGIELRSPSLQEDSLLTEPPGKPKNTGVSSLSLLQGLFPTQESEWGLLHGRQILYQLNSQENSLASYMGLPVFLGVAGLRRAFSMLCASESRDCFYRGMDRTLVYALGRVHIVIQPSSCSESLLLWGPEAPIGGTRPCRGGQTGATQTGRAVVPERHHGGSWPGLAGLPDLAGWGERSRGEEGGPGLAVGVLPSQHSFHPDARLSLKGPGPHTLKAVSGWEDQSSAQGNGGAPCLSHRPEPPFLLSHSTGNESQCHGNFLHWGIKWSICLNSRCLFWLLYT